MKVSGIDELQRWPCQSSHRITVSLDGVKPLTVTLPYPILVDSFKATLLKNDGAVEVIAAKALNDLWPEDVIRHQFRWNAEKLDPWTHMDGIGSHNASQYHREIRENLKKPESYLDALTGARSLISTLFNFALENKLLLALMHRGPPERKEWLIRVHLPVRTSSSGAPVLLLTVLDQRQAELWTNPELKQIIFDGDLSKNVLCIFMKSEEVGQLMRHILRYNSTKIQPTEWQKKNLPQGGDSSWLATFVQPLYLDGHYKEDLEEQQTTGGYCCGACGKRSAPLKKCSRCKSTSYCSVECQRVHWPYHKPFCVQA